MTHFPKVTIGLDLGDRRSTYSILTAAARVAARGQVPTDRAGILEWLRPYRNARVILEVGSHSPWVSRLISELGHTAIVANARKVKAISAGTRKSDAVDAETLARLGRLDPALLAPITHRGLTAQVDLAQLRARDALVRARTLLINHVRGALKAVGHRVTAAVSSGTFARKVAPTLPDPLEPALRGVLATIGVLTDQIAAMERTLERLAQHRYPETGGLRQVTGVGLLTALSFVLTLEDPARFAQSRSVGAYLGLVPRRRQSGQRDPQLRITKTGDPMVRRHLVTAAQYILGPFGPPCDLRRWGEALMIRGGLNAKKRAIVAVARKLATVLHHLWRSGAAYQPIRVAA
jgi:transposase